MCSKMKSCPLNPCRTPYDFHIKLMKYTEADRESQFPAIADYY